MDLSYRNYVNHTPPRLRADDYKKPAQGFPLFYGFFSTSSSVLTPIPVPLLGVLSSVFDTEPDVVIDPC